MNSFLQINGRYVKWNEVENFPFPSPFEANTIQFIKEWLSGKAAFSINTSGSTGTPKTISITREQMIASARYTINALALRAGQNVLVCLDTKYIAGKMMLVRAMENQMNIIARTPASNPLAQLDQQPDFAAVVPIQLEEILKDKASTACLNAMQAVIVGGAPVSLALESRVQEVKAPVYSTYGMTETVSHIALKKLNGPDRSKYYQAFDEVQLGLDKHGCLTIQSVLTGHQQITTNDRVLLHNHDRFEWLGRIDHVINSGGIKVQSEKVERVVENLFNQLGIQSKFFIAGLPDEKLGEKITLIVESEKPFTNASDIIRQLKKQLAQYEAPKSILYLPEFKETETGKINRISTLKQKNN